MAGHCVPELRISSRLHPSALSSCKVRSKSEEACSFSHPLEYIDGIFRPVRLQHVLGFPARTVAVLQSKQKDSLLRLLPLPLFDMLSYVVGTGVLVVSAWDRSLHASADRR